MGEGASAGAAHSARARLLRSSYCCARAWMAARMHGADACARAWPAARAMVALGADACAHTPPALDAPLQSPSRESSAHTRQASLLA
eukprot:PRCOL_00006269-RA